MFKLCFYVTEADAEAVKAAVFDAGGGRIGDYDCCCWQVAGQGQFRPLTGSNPHLGSVGNLERVTELRIELVCEDSLIKDVIEALKKAHPYEEVAYDVTKVIDI